MTDLAMNCGEFTDKLADFLERDVSESTRAAMEAHALDCGECGPLLADLRRLRIDAANLPELAPSRDLWSGIAERIETPVVALPSDGRQAPSRRVARRVWLGLAAAGLVAVTATVTREMTRRSIGNPAPTTVASRDTQAPAQPAATIGTVPVSTSDSALRPSSSKSVTASAPTNPGTATMHAVSNKPSAEQTYNREIAGLVAIYKFKQRDLDSSTVAVVTRNMAIIDSAIAQCRIALRRDPASSFLMQSLSDALDTKVQLLRTAAALPPARM